MSAAKKKRSVATGAIINVVNGSELKAALRSVLFNVAKEDSRYAFSGIYLTPYIFTSGEDKDIHALRVVTTDGKALTHFTTLTADKWTKAATGGWYGDTGYSVKPGWIIPLSSAKEIIAALWSGPVQFSFWPMGDKPAKFRVDAVSANGRLTRIEASTCLEGSFPDVHAVIPTESHRTVVVNFKNMLAALKCVQPTAQLRDPPVARITINTTALTVAARAIDSTDFKVEAAAVLNGLDITPKDAPAHSGMGWHIGVDPVRLSKALDASDLENLQLSFTEASRPIVITNKRPLTSGEASWTHVLMPVNLEKF
jgi:DNA polymerase III sliding clamp (beta) subunit (PCNA family)